MTTDIRTTTSRARLQFLKPDFHDLSDPGGCPFRVDLRELAEQRDRARSSSDAELLIELAENYMDYQMYDRAADAFNTARDLGHDDFAIWHSLAMAYNSSGVLDGAIYAHQEALARETPDDYWWGTCESLGLCLWKCERREDSLAAFRRAVDRTLTNLSVWCMIHAACDVLGHIDGKAEAQQKVAGLSNTGSYYRMVAQGYESISATEQAKELYKEATTKDEHPILPWSNLGRCYLALSQIEEATHAYEQCILCDAIPDRANPHPPAWTALSFLYGVQGEYEESIHAANSALTYWESGTALANAGASNLAIGETANGIECLLKACRLRPDRSEVTANLASAYTIPSQIRKIEEQAAVLRDFHGDSWI